MSTDKPSVSLILYAYQERDFIEEAVLSVLAQDYSPLEIILSDDGSADGTFDVMSSLAQSYRGPHSVVLNRNERNVGIGSQLNSCIEKSGGELIFLANGDDISEQYRVSRTVEVWMKKGRPTALWSDLNQIDADGKELGRTMDTRILTSNLEAGVRDRFCGGGAASVAFAREVFTRFGPLSDNLILEDSPLFLRAVLIGTVHHINERLVRYRVHEGNISQSYAGGGFDDWRARNVKSVIWQKRESVKAYLQMLRDLHQIPAEGWPLEDLKRAQWVGMEKLMENSILRDYYANEFVVPFRRRFGALLNLAMTILKAELKRRFPFIERRNARWHYRSVLSDSQKPR